MKPRFRENSIDRNVSKTTYSYTFKELLYKSKFMNLSENLGNRIVDCVIVSIKKNLIFLDVGFKTNIIFPLEEFTSFVGSEDLKVGQKIPFLFNGIQKLDGSLTLDHSRAYKKLKKQKIDNFLQDAKYINARILRLNTHGAYISIGGVIYFVKMNKFYKIKYKKLLVGSKKTFSVFPYENYSRNRNRAQSKKTRNLDFSRKQVLMQWTKK